MLREVNKHEIDKHDCLLQLQKCESPFIVGFYGVSREEGEWLIRLELMDGLSLDLYGQLPGPVLGPVTLSLVSGLQYLWSMNVMHRGKSLFCILFFSLVWSDFFDILELFI